MLKAGRVKEIRSSYSSGQPEARREGRLFLAYSHLDGSFADALCSALHARGVEAWRDTEHGTAGPLEEVLFDAMERCDAVLVVLSVRSVASAWVEREVKRASQIERERSKNGRTAHVLLPIALDDDWANSCRWARGVRKRIESYNVLSFAGWQDPAHLRRMVTKLVEGVEAYYRRSVGSTQVAGDGPESATNLNA